MQLLQTFADQAVIAIENSRLFEEAQQRNIDLRESLQQQTATADVLGVISVRRPTPCPPVFEAIAEERQEAKLCKAASVQCRAALLAGEADSPHGEGPWMLPRETAELLRKGFPMVPDREQLAVRPGGHQRRRRSLHRGHSRREAQVPVRRVRAG